MRVFPLVLLASAIVPLDHLTLQDALTIAHSSVESTHRRFHADYHFPVQQAPVDFVSIVSPFRRVVLSAETSALTGRRGFGQREALAMLAPDPERFEVYVELTFHPHNTFIGVPDYVVELEPAASPKPALLPREMERLPRFGPRLDDGRYPFPYPHPGPARRPTGSEPLLGGTLIARFDGREIDPRGTYAVAVKDGTRVMTRAKVDFARFR